MITYATRNIIKFLFLFFFAISNQNVFSQDLEEEPAENPINLFDYLGNDGWYSLPPEIQISITEFFDLYREQLGMQENDEMIRLNPDEEILDNIPIFYQQFYKGFEVEKAIVMIITENSYIKKMKCNIALGLSFDVNGDIISENDALSKALETLNAEEYAWQNLDNEMGLIIDQNNLNATNYPTGKLLIGKANGIEIIPESYMFAWKFDILCSAPRKLRSVYVDPLNGQVTTGCVQGELSAVPMPNYNFDLQPNISDEFDNTLNPNLWTHSENFACINGVNYSENFGTTGVNTQVNSYTGWQNTSITYQSTSTNQTEVSNTNASSGYPGVSGTGNIYFATSGANNFIISGIDTHDNTDIKLSFGLRRDAGSVNDLFNIEYSTDGTNFTQITITQPITNNTWSYQVIS